MGKCGRVARRTMRRSIHSVPMRLSLYVRGTRLVRSLSRDRESGKHHRVRSVVPTPMPVETRAGTAGAAGIDSRMVDGLQVNDPAATSQQQHAQYYGVCLGSCPGRDARG